RADDSAATSVKVGNRQACYTQKAPAQKLGLFAFRSLPQAAPHTFTPARPHYFDESGDGRNACKRLPGAVLTFRV
ncbi:hypothetical protein, partial [Noviherbaspirillum sp.]|uniref:hypothetical protein n=1 Tax=Noviherbaspirillum sp. TaxID=1926288 RepID=UPI002B471374